LKGETALVTGGGSGIGLAIAAAMVEAGARVVITGRRETVLREAVCRLGTAASWYVHDVTDIGSSERLLGDIEEAVGEVTVLVNNAGVHLKKPAMDTGIEEFRVVLETHVGGAFALSRLAARRMIGKRHGSILFIASMASLFGIPNVVAYSAAKTAHLGLVRALAVELGPYGVRVNAIAPGWIETSMSRQALAGDPQRSQKVLSRTPLGCFGQPRDVGLAAVYLSSPAASFISGVVLPVDGGVSIGF